MNQSRAAFAAIVTLIPLAMVATIYTGRPAIQDRQEQEKITIVASFYPLYEFASRVVGDRAEVSSLVPGAIANEIPDGKVLVLSPNEGIGNEEQAAGIGYIDKMKQNIANLKEGLECR